MPPDLAYLLLAADTVVLTHPQPLSSDVSYDLQPTIHQELLEKPASKEDNLRMLLDLNGSVCEVVTGVVVGRFNLPNSGYEYLLKRSLVYPTITAPGYAIK